MTEERPAGSLRWLEQFAGAGGNLSPLNLEKLAASLLQLIHETDRPNGYNLNLLLGQLDIEFERWADGHENRFSRTWLRDLFRMYAHRPELVLPIRGATVLELGCGTANPLALLMVFILLGASRGIGIDLDTMQNPELAAGGVARCVSYMLSNPDAIAGHLAPPALEIVKNAEGVDFERLRQGDLAGGVGSRLEYRTEDAGSLSFPDSSVDIVLSNSFLEHIPDVDRVIKEMARVTRAGGWGVHQIDGIDHLLYEEPDLHPLDFLRLETDDSLVRGCNRVRPLEFLPRFERDGFRVVATNVYRKIEMPDSLMGTFAERFRSLSREILAATGIVVYLRRVGEASA